MQKPVVSPLSRHHDRARCGHPAPHPWRALAAQKILPVRRVGAGRRDWPATLVLDHREPPCASRATARCSPGPCSAARPRAAPGGRVAVRQRRPAAGLLWAAGRLTSSRTGSRSCPTTSAASATRGECCPTSRPFQPCHRRRHRGGIRAASSPDDPRQIGYLGASAAGSIAPRAAESSKAAFLATASPGVLRHSLVAKSSTSPAAARAASGGPRRPRLQTRSPPGSAPASTHSRPSSVLASRLCGCSAVLTATCAPSRAARCCADQARTGKGLDDRRLPRRGSRPVRRPADRSARCAGLAEEWGRRDVMHANRGQPAYTQAKSSGREPPHRS